VFSGSAKLFRFKDIVFGSNGHGVMVEIIWWWWWWRLV
jgi:hypothetical protein